MKNTHQCMDNKEISQDLEQKVDRNTFQNMIYHISMLPFDAIYIVTFYTNKSIQLLKKHYYKKHNIEYMWLCSERYHGERFFNHLEFCVRKDRYTKEIKAR